MEELYIINNLLLALQNKSWIELEVKYMLVIEVTYTSKKFIRHFWKGVDVMYNGLTSATLSWSPVIRITQNYYSLQPHSGYKLKCDPKI